MRSITTLLLLVSVLLPVACGRTSTPANGAEPRLGETRPAPAAEDAREADPVPPPADPAKPATCPVCGLEFPAGEARAAARHEGRVYRFLLEDHADAFRRNPGRYLGGDGAPSP